MAIRFVYFDLDDTLCGYWDASKAAMAQAFAEMAPVEVDAMRDGWARAFRQFSRNLKESPWYPIYLQRGEPTRTEQMRLALLEVGHDDPGLARRMGDRYAELRDANLTLFPEVIEVLDALAPTHGMGLITNGPADIQRQEVATLGLGERFAPILIEGEMGYGKPDARVYARAEAEAGVRKDEVLMVGNSYGHDIRGAMDAGWHAIWIRRPSDVSPSSGRPEERPLDGPEPTLTIGNLREILTFLDQK